MVKKLRLNLWKGQPDRAFVVGEEGNVVGEAHKFCKDAWMVYVNGVSSTLHDDEVEVGSNCWNCLDFVPHGQEHPECPHYNS